MDKSSESYSVFFIYMYSICSPKFILPWLFSDIPHYITMGFEKCYIPLLFAHCEAICGFRFQNLVNFKDKFCTRHIYSYHTPTLWALMNLSLLNLHSNASIFHPMSGQATAWLCCWLCTPFVIQSLSGSQPSWHWPSLRLSYV